MTPINILFDPQIDKLIHTDFKVKELKNPEKYKSFESAAKSSFIFIQTSLFLRNSKIIIIDPLSATQKTKFL